MLIPRSYIENYSNALNVVSERARSALVDALSQIDYTADVASIREAVIAIMQPACGASSTMAARLAADFYDGLRLRFGIDDGFMAEVDSQREPEATSGAIRAFVDELDKPIPNVSAFQQLCVDRIDYETRKAANECVAYNAKRDPKKPKWARVPTGSETCSFCIMLASRGFAYQSEETASHAHAHCDCRVIPSWDKSPFAQGYDPDKYYDMWKHPEQYPELQEERNARRRELYAKQKRELGETLVLSDHVKSRMAERGITESQIVDAKENPLHIKPETVDEQGRKSYQIVGKNVTIVVNPKNDVIISVWNTHSRIRRKYEREDTSTD